MPKTILGRSILAGVALWLFIVLAMATSAYFMGWVGVGKGWPAFWMSISVSVILWGFLATVVGLGTLLIVWIIKGAKNDFRLKKIRKLKTGDIYEIEGVKFDLRWWTRHSGGVMDPRDSELTLHLEMVEE